VAAVFVAFPLLVIAVVGDARRRPDISDTSRNVAITLSAMALLSGVRRRGSALLITRSRTPPPRAVGVGGFAA
jgi:hypothetical protein